MIDGFDPIDNYMDYSPNDCQERFTSGTSCVWAYCENVAEGFLGFAIQVRLNGCGLNGTSIVLQIQRVPRTKVF